MFLKTILFKPENSKRLGVTYDTSNIKRFFGFIFNLPSVISEPRLNHD